MQQIAGISADVVIGVVAYCTCSSTMIIVNKATMRAIPAAGVVNLSQMLFAISTVYFLKYVLRVKVDEFEGSKVWAYAIYACGFAAGLFCNMRALAVSNIETIIVFRSCCPLVVSLLEYFFLGRALPTPRSAGALLLILVGAALYVYNDKEFRMSGVGAYSWSFAYFLVICFQLTYGKYLVTEVKMEMWTRVLYNQTLGIPLTLFMAVASADFATVQGMTFTTNKYGILLASCIMGVGISYAGFNCQRVVSGTSYAIIGVMNKMLTLLINVFIWDSHASNAGIASLMVCIAGGVLYRQSPLRHTYEGDPSSARTGNAPMRPPAGSIDSTEGGDRRRLLGKGIEDAVSRGSPPRPMTAA